MIEIIREAELEDKVIENLTNFKQQILVPA